MFRKRITRPMPAGAKVSADGKKAKVVVKGETRTYEVSATGKLVDYSPRWYCQVGDKMVPLSEDRQESELMEAELLLDRKRGGVAKAKRPLAPKSRQDLEGLMDEWIASEYGSGSGLNPIHIASFQRRVRLLLGAGISTVAHREDADAGDRIAAALAELAVPGKPAKLPAGNAFSPHALYKLARVNRSTLLRVAKALGIAGSGRKKSRRYTREESEQILASLVKGRSPATITGYRSAVTTFCRWLVRRGVLARMPALPRVRGNPKTFRPRRAITQEVMLQICASVERRGAKLAGSTATARSLLYQTAFYSALRLRALREIRVGDLMQEADGGWSLSVRAETDKTGHARRIPIVAPGLGDALAAMVKGRPASALIWPGLPPTMSATLQSDLRDAGIPFVTTEGRFDFHSFRHSGATHFLTRGVSPLVVARLGGWASLEMLSRRYGHLDTSNLAQLLKGGA